MVFIIVHAHFGLYAIQNRRNVVWLASTILYSIWTRWSCSSSYRVIFIVCSPSHQICDPKSASFISVGHPFLLYGHQTLVCMSRQTAMFPFTATRIRLIYTLDSSADRALTRRFAVRGITPDSRIVRETCRHYDIFAKMALCPAMRLPF